MGTVYGDANGLYQVELRDDLREDQIEEAEKILEIIRGPRPFFGVAGVMLVTGPPRQGKDLISTALTLKIRRYFKGIRILRDEAPTDVFGPWTLWNEGVFRQDIGNMAVMQRAENENSARKHSKIQSESVILDNPMTPKEKTRVRELARDWAENQGKIIFHKAVAHLTEFWRYQNNRRPMDAINIALGGINKMWGHTETLLMGGAQWTHDLDRFTCLPWVTHELRVRLVTVDPRTGYACKPFTRGHLYYTEYNFSTQRLIPINTRPIVIDVSGYTEVPDLGVSHVDADGTVHWHRWFDCYNSKSAPIIRLAPGQFPDREKATKEGDASGMRMQM